MTISISDLRGLARDHPELEDSLLDLIAAAEGLNDAHESECGCDAPGAPDCAWPAIDGQLLTTFHFDEEVTRL